MNKLKLDLDSVAVETFEVSADGERRAGSVDAYETPVFPSAGGGGTCFVSCEETCGTAACGTCAPSCWPSCRDPECA